MRRDYRHDFSRIAVLPGRSTATSSHGERSGVIGRALQAAVEPDVDARPEEASTLPAAGKCPKQSVKIYKPFCGSDYGAVVRYCYEGAKGWWFKESVVSGANDCVPDAVIQQNPVAGQSLLANSSCIDDFVFNQNGPPWNVGPCKTVTQQTLYAGPTESAVEQCKYENRQEVRVKFKDKSSSKSGTVTVSAGGDSRSCEWEQP
jgi:hypothetical protein